MSGQPGQVTLLLARWRGGDDAALSELLRLTEHELRAIARRRMRKERANHTLQATEVVNEAFIRLVEQRQVLLENRAHFFGIVSRLMTELLVDHARSRNRKKRWGQLIRKTLTKALNLPAALPGDQDDVTRALEALARTEPLQAQIVWLRFFVGLSQSETAEALELSKAKVRRQWAEAKRFLYAALGPQASA